MSGTESELPNPFAGLDSAGINAAGPGAFMIDYGWHLEEDVKNAPSSEMEMLQEMWDVATAQGRAQGQTEAAAGSTQKVGELVDEVQRLSESLRSAQARLAHAAEHEDWIRQSYKQEIADLKLKELNRRESKVGFRVWSLVSKATARLDQAVAEKVATYDRD